MSANVIESFFVALGFEIDTKELDNFSSKMEDAKDSVLGISKVAGIAAAAVGAFITKIGYGIDDLGDFAEAEQVAVDMVSELGRAAQLSGSDLNAVKSSISAVNKTVGEAVLGIGRGAMTFNKLGMSAKNADGSVKSFDQILEEVSDKMQGLSRQESIAMAEKLGIDRTLIPMLLKGKEHIAALREEARAFGSVTAEDAEKAGLFADAMDRTRFMLGGLTKQIAVNLMPAMTNMLDGMRKWLMANREIVQSTITRFLQFVTMLLGTFWDWIVRAANGLSGLLRWIGATNAGFVLMGTALALIAKYAAYKAFGVIASGIRLVAGALTVANTAALVTSALIGGIVIALALLIDDYVNWKEGNDSVIGGLIEQFPWLLDVIQSIQKGVGALVDFWVEQWKTIGPPVMELGKALWSLVTVLVGALWPVVKMIFTGWAYIMAAVIPMVASLLSMIIGGWVNLASWLAAGAAVLVDVLSAIVEGIVAVFGMTFANIGDLWGALTDLLTGNFQGVADHLIAIWDRVVSFWLSGFEKIKAAAQWVAEKLGLAAPTAKAVAQQDHPTPTAKAVAQSPVMQDALAQTQSAQSVVQKSGMHGRAGNAGNTSTTVTQTTQITGTQIHVSSPDPAKAGEAVSKELERMNRQATRNGQSAVAL